MSKLYDISMLVTEEIQVYKNKAEKKPEIRTMSDFSTGSAYESRIAMDVHTGTHVDAPLHMIQDGKTIESIALDSLIGPARVLDLTHVEDSIGKADLVPFHITKGEWILFKTKNSFSEQFDFEFTYLNKEGAAYLAEIGVKGVGTDGLGIERSQPDHETHKQLFQQDIVIVEGLRFKDVPEGSYWMVIAPLKLTGIEASPARAFLMA